MKFKVDFKAGIKVIQRELVKHGPDLLFAPELKGNSCV